ncbi:hypothetical protein B4U80_12781 [Leptotrombidium deliense]|uniref:EH domain-containing protein n=1 Tax=Leptotrombidium deliense TaxID=299467 RepID=A0A443SM90_9ACAR|nr:hypothetical protein B4U80_12781 [Leptotrombidium deliense]
MPFGEPNAGLFCDEKTMKTVLNASNSRLSGVQSNSSLSDSKNPGLVLGRLNETHITSMTMSANTSRLGQQSNRNQRSSGNQSTVRVAYPMWCRLDCQEIPSLYVRVWHLVKINDGSPLCDTNKLYPILLSSNLHRDILANIWAQVNKLSPGQLTTQELFLALAMIAIVQQNATQYLNVKQLYYIQSPPVPNLSFPGLNPTEAIQGSKHQNFNSVISRNTTTAFEVNDEFADFQCVSLPKVDNNIDLCDVFQKLEKNNENSVATESKSFLLEDNDFSDFQMASSVNNLPEKPAGLSSPPLLTVITPLVKTSDNSFNNKVNSEFDDRNLSLLLETNGESTTKDRYSALKQLVTETDTCDDDFGDFKSYSIDDVQNNLKSEPIYSVNIAQWFEVWLQILRCCRHVLHKSFNVLIVNHGEESSVEALNTEEGKEFCSDLVNVFLVTKRIKKKFQAFGSRNENIEQLLEDVEVTFRSLRKLFNQASVCLELDCFDGDDDLLNSKNSSKTCSICGCSEYGKRNILLNFAGNEYHSSCANLWLNCVSSSLPTIDNNNVHIL